MATSIKMPNYSPEELQFLLHHMVFSEPLPEGADEMQYARKGELALLRLLSESARKFALALPDIKRNRWRRVQGYRLLWIRAQNASLFVRKAKDAYEISCMEVSAKAAKVIESTGSLKWSFPGRTVSISPSLAEEKSFFQELSSLMSKLCIEFVDELQSITRKAGSDVVELRDTPSPALVTEMVMASLATWGQAVPVAAIEKRIRDESLWNNSELPFRRSPLWLAIKVGVQLTCAHEYGKTRSHVEYKNFLCFVLAELGDLVQATKRTQRIHPPEVLHSIAMKLVRRANKAADILFPVVRDSVQESVDGLRSELDRTWASNQQKLAIVTPVVRSGPDDYTTDVVLRNCQEKIKLARCVASLPESQTAFVPRCFERCFAGAVLPVGDPFERPDLPLSLFDFEEWTRVHMHDLPVSGPEHLVPSLSSLVDRYTSAALLHYDRHPQQLSLMLLTVLDIWVFVDKLVVEKWPILRQYKTEIPDNLLYPCLFEDKSQLLRLKNIESHLSDRIRQCMGESIFALTTPQSLSVRFYESSRHHQKLRRDIEAAAELKWTKTQEEGKKLVAKYDELMAIANSTNCDIQADASGSKRHADDCKRCTAWTEAQRMKIEVYEWPLPENETASKAVVFELDVPKEIAAWRSMAWLIVHKLGRVITVPTTGEDSKKGDIFSYDGLKQFAKLPGQPLIFASAARSFYHSHYRYLEFPIQIEKLRVNHGHRYELYDTRVDSWISKQNAEVDVARLCVISLPDGRYRNLQYAVDNTKHTSNEVVASQYCEANLDPHEYDAFAHLRAGGRLQWLNISAALVTPNLSLNREEVHSLMVQAALQAGPPATSSELREAHEILEDHQVVTRLLGNIRERLQSVRANWKENGVVNLLLDLTNRLLALATSDELRDNALGLLCSIRKITIGWARNLNAKLDSRDQHDHDSLRMHLLKIALIIKATFDGGHPVFVERGHDWDIYLEAAIYAHDNLPGRCDMLSPSLRRQLLCDERRSHRLESCLRDVSSREAEVIHKTVRAHWPFFQPEQSWRACESPNERWIWTTQKEDGGTAIKIYLNLLNGSLLVGGRPLSRLPRAILQHSLFLRLFQTLNPRVFVSDDPALEYVLAAPIQHNMVYIALHESDLIVRIRNGGCTLQLLPHEWFRDDLPSALVTDRVHWLDLVSGIVEARPLKAPFQESLETWIMRPTDKDGTWNITCRDVFLLDPECPFARDALRALSPLEDHANMIVSHSSGNLHAELPRYNLSFVGQSDSTLACPKLRAKIAGDQNSGTFIGLRSCVVLEHLGQDDSDTDRSILVPHGQVVVERGVDHSHTSVNITTEGAHSARFFIYKIDKVLRRLQSDPGPARLYKAYLHAVTASVTPDPLTGRTGTEEALSILRTVQLTEPADDGIVEILDSIQRLSPQRSFYPAYLSYMQSITWNKTLPAACQHEEFASLAHQIYTSGSRLAVFYEKVSDENLKVLSCPALVARARCRNAPFRVFGFGGEVQPRDHDVDYDPRDRGVWSEAAQRASKLTGMTIDWTYGREDLSSDLFKSLQELNQVQGFDREFHFETISEIVQVSLSHSWGALYNLTRRGTPDEKFKLCFLFSMAAFGQTSMSHLKTLLAIAFCTKLKDNPGPAHDSYALNDGLGPDGAFLKRIKSCIKVPPLPKREKQGPARVKEHREEMSRGRRQATEMYRILERQWPCQVPQLTESMNLLNMKMVKNESNSSFKAWNKNSMFRKFLANIENVLFTQGTSHTWAALTDVVNDPTTRLSPTSKQNPTLAEVLKEAELPLKSKPFEVVYQSAGRSVGVSPETEELRSIISIVGMRDEAFAARLRTSLDTHEHSFCKDVPLTCPFPGEYLRKNKAAWSSYVDDLEQAFYRSYEKQRPPGRITNVTCFERHITVQEVLQILREPHLSKRERHAAIVLAEGVASLQRVQRLIRLNDDGDIINLVKELEHGRRSCWLPENHPEWLALEIENDLAIRPLQAEVAEEMINPSSRANSCLQLNMGEGKSAIIVHMVAATLADKKHICRLFVIRPLIRQMTTLLQRRHQGLSSRAIYHIPIYRKTSLDETMLSRLEALWEECRLAGGILLTQPEHDLSLKLKGFDRLLIDPEFGERLERSYYEHRRICRDIIDESDDALSANFQLTYAMGHQRTLENAPYRWTNPALLLDMVEEALPEIIKDSPDTLLFEKMHEGAFPQVHFLHANCWANLLEAIGRTILTKGVPQLSFATYNSVAREAFLRFMTLDIVPRTDTSLVEKHVHGAALLNMLQIRGLLGGGVLQHVLEDKRWLVEYGLDLRRSRLAVPYKAKRTPAPSSDFAHPEIIILLTFLSYYYTGLEESQLRECFHGLYQAPDPSQEYESWMARSPSISNDLRDLRNVNLEDSHQISEQLWPFLQYNKKTIDFFLTVIVFPLDGKEFTEKLSTSAWDIPAENHAADGRSAITTGFSGTNDNSSLLPYSITQNDLERLGGTTAMVMSYLLLAENRACYQLSSERSSASGVPAVLKLITALPKRPQVLIDVGALIVESQNEDVAKDWLSLETRKEAAIFFNDDHEIMIIDKTGARERLANSPYRDRLEQCLVYLDEFHTRGTDVKLPFDAHAVVTIGPRLVKDRLVQACMRMRKLGHGQSIAFVINQDVSNYIEQSTSSKADNLDSADALRYCLMQTCTSNERLRPLWASHGLAHRQRQLAQQTYRREGMQGQAGQAFLATLSEPDGRGLEELYHPRMRADTSVRLALSASEMADPLIQKLEAELKRLSSRMTERVRLNEEQEREIEREIQQVVQTERPAKAQPEKHSISGGLADFISKGVVLDGAQFMTARLSLNQTKFSDKASNIDPFDFLLVTKDFARTVALRSEGGMDDYLRSVSFILASSEPCRLLVISPFEANILLPRIKASDRVALQVYAPRTTKSMRSLDRVPLHTIGGSHSLTAFQWNDEQRCSVDLFAGQLYFSSFFDYATACERIGGRKEGQPELRQSGGAYESPDCTDNLIVPYGHPAVRFLSGLATCRRKGKSFVATNLGALLGSRPVRPQDFSNPSDASPEDDTVVE